MSKEEQAIESIMISALEHMSYCPRQCGLIHIEHIWDENLFTLRGEQKHARTDEPTTRRERGKVILRGLPIWNDELGVVGQCDSVEADQEVRIPMPPGTMRPIEYKSGKRTPHEHARIQAGAQALCLEAMFDTSVKEIAVFYIASKERVLIDFDEPLRARVLDVIASTRAMIRGEALPDPLADRRCAKCSLIDACQPFAIQNATTKRCENLFVPSKEGSWT